MAKKFEGSCPDYINNKLKVAAEVWFEKGYIKSVTSTVDHLDRTFYKFYNERGIEVAVISKNACFFTIEQLQEFL